MISKNKTKTQPKPNTSTNPYFYDAIADTENTFLDIMTQ
jgi:hypothetical protein